MDGPVSLALDKVLEDFKVHEDKEQALEEIDRILLFPDEIPVYRYGLHIQTKEYTSDLFLIHSKKLSEKYIEEVLKENPKASPAGLLLRHGFKIADKSWKSHLESDFAQIDMVQNKEGEL